MSKYTERSRIRFELEIGLEEETFTELAESLTYILNSFNHILTKNNAGELFLQYSRREN